MLVDATPPTYSVLLIRTDGKIAAQVQATMPRVYGFTHFPPSPPLVSLSGSRVYYADGSSIKYLMPDGSTGDAMAYPGGAQSVAGFAVSPDDKRIAVGLMTFNNTGAYQGLDLFVTDVGGANRVELFTSTTVSEWPVGWTNGRLVLALGPPVNGNLSNNPYNGFEGYHVADAANGNRLVAMSNECILGPLQQNGTACSSGGWVTAQAFDGTVRVFQPGAGVQDVLLLSPDGTRIAGRPGALGSPIVMYNDVGTVTTMSQSGVPMGWIDDQHLVFFGPNGFERKILDVASGSVIPMQPCACGNSGVFFGALAPANRAAP